MGLEDLILNPEFVAETMAFDTTYSYIIQQTFPYDAYDVSFIKIQLLILLICQVMFQKQIGIQ